MIRKLSIARRQMRPRACLRWRAAYLDWLDRETMRQCSYHLAALWRSLDLIQQQHALFALELWEALSEDERERAWYRAICRCSRAPERIIRYSDPPEQWSPSLRQIWLGEPRNLARRK